jgi:hypothetical protein
VPLPRHRPQARPRRPHRRRRRHRPGLLRPLHRRLGHLEGRHVRRRAVLDGSTIAGDRTYTATLEATVYQDDLTAGDLIDYSWTHKGTQVPFTFTPYAGGRAITGQLVVDPLDVGGDVNKKNTSDIKWGCVGRADAGRRPHLIR